MIPLIIGAAVIVSAIAIGVFWNEIKNFINKSWEKIKSIALPGILAGFRTYLQTGSVEKALFKAAQVAIQKFYSQLEDGKWKETTVAREISFEDLPSDIKTKLNTAKEKALDISDSVRKVLKLER